MPHFVSTSTKPAKPSGLPFVFSPIWKFNRSRDCLSKGFSQKFGAPEGVFQMGDFRFHIRYFTNGKIVRQFIKNRLPPLVILLFESQ